MNERNIKLSRRRLLFSALLALAGLFVARWWWCMLLLLLFCVFYQAAKQCNSSKYMYALPWTNCFYIGKICLKIPQKFFFWNCLKRQVFSEFRRPRLNYSTSRTFQFFIKNKKRTTFLPFLKCGFIIHFMLWWKMKNRAKSKLSCWLFQKGKEEAAIAERWREIIPLCWLYFSCNSFHFFLEFTILHFSLLI